MANNATSNLQAKLSKLTASHRKLNNFLMMLNEDLEHLINNYCLKMQTWFLRVLSPKGEK